jgi:predicted 3-demethylubiquinone-9 3-methyltransferase (glyoxalase superfamily)
MVTLAEKITTFLTFFGNAEEAMNVYVSLFDRSQVLTIERYGAGPRGRGRGKRQARHLVAERPAVHVYRQQPPA